MRIFVIQNSNNEVQTLLLLVPGRSPIERDEMWADFVRIFNAWIREA